MVTSVSALDGNVNEECEVSEDFEASIEYIVVSAALFDRASPAYKRLGYARYWPDVIDERHSIVYSLVDESDEIRKRLGAGISMHRRNWDRFNSWMSSCGDLTPVDKRLLWARLGKGDGTKRSWREVARLVGGSHETCRSDYGKMVNRLMVWIKRESI